MHTIIIITEENEQYVHKYELIYRIILKLININA